MVGDSVKSRAGVLAAFLVAALALATLAPGALGHPASSVVCTYDFEAQELTVTVTHPAGDLSSHYIYSIEVWRNGVLMDNHSYTGQPSGTFTQVYPITAQDGDVLTATTHCNLGGTRSGEVTVQEIPSDDPSPARPERPLWHYHAAFMVLGLALMLAAIPLAKLKPKNWLKIHRALGITAAAFVALGFIIGIQMAGGRFSGLHNVMGLLTTLMAFAEPVLGFGIFKAKQKKQIRLAHIWVGRITPIMMIITILLGLSLVGII